MTTEVHASSIVENGAKIGENVSIGPFCHIGSNIVLGDNSKIHSNVCEDIKKTIIENYHVKSAKLIESPIKGQKGNKEFFIYFKI